MPKFLATEDYDRDAYVEEVREHLLDRGLTHLRVRRHADLVIIESGPKTDAFKHARFRRVAKHLWRLEMGTASGWEPTPFRDQLKALLPLLTDAFGWTVADRS
jgi:hypothetical protein